MFAGGSAEREAQRQAKLRDAHLAAAQQADESTRNYNVAAQTERQTAATLSRLSAVGYHLLADRAWPGSRRAQVDLVVVGPTGLFLVDTKAWAEPRIQSHRLYRGQEDASDELDKLESLLDATQSVFADIGLPPGEVHALMVFAGRNGINHRIGQIEILGEHDVVKHIAGGGMRLTSRELDDVLTKAIAYFPPAGQPAPINAIVAEPVLPLPKPKSAAIQLEALFPESAVEEALLSSMLQDPIERWMCFLHPMQAKQIKRKFSGPSRIRGAAGTGKTVVGLHRAAYLARIKPTQRVLVTSFVRTLPIVLNNLFAQMAPDAVDRVDFIPVHKFARQILSDRGKSINVSSTAVDHAFAKAWLGLRSTDPDFAQVVTLSYLREEVSKVIKARGIHHFDRYADLARTGRKQRLTTPQREIVWQFYETYTRHLREARAHDWDDLITLARNELHREPLADYGAVIVDEVQDLTAESLALLHGLVGDAPDGLTLIGDTEQSIYPGGYTLSEIGISVAGRSVVLNTNYRNTREILDFARLSIEGDDVGDIDDSDDSPDGSSRASMDGVSPGSQIATQRSGQVPEIVYLETADDWAELMVARVREVTTEIGTGLGDIAILAETNAKVEQIRRELRRAKLAWVNLVDYDGIPVPAIKIGTVKRAKGLEFKHVLLPDVRRELLGERSDNERDILARRELYVAMTRARDGLWAAVR